jgi:hypothetical protein
VAARSEIRLKVIVLLRTLSVLSLLLATTVVVCHAQQEAAPPDAQPPDTTAVDPNAPPPKKSFVKRMFSVQAVTATLPGAIIQQFHDWPEEWGRKRAGFEKRAASLYGQFVIGLAIEEGVKAIHHEDTHYRRRGYGNFFGRTGYVIVHTVLARQDDGHLTMAYSLPANAYGSWAIATLWSPREFRTAGSIFEWGSASVGVSAGTNLLREFWPDIKSVFKKKK